MHRYFRNIGNTERFSSCKSSGVSNEIIKPPTTTDDSLAPALTYIGIKTREKLNGGCLEPDKIIFTHGATVNIYNVHEISLFDSNSNYPTLENFLFGAVKLNQNSDIDKYKCFGDSIGFDRRRTFSFPTAGFGSNVIIFGVDMSSFVHINNKKKYIVIYFVLCRTWVKVLHMI